MVKGKEDRVYYHLDMKTTDHKELAARIFYYALSAVDPYVSVKNYIDRIRATYINDKYNKLIIAGFGKASCSMAKATEDFLLDLIDAGIVITKYKHCDKVTLKKFKVYEAGHPVPDENGLFGTGQIIKLLKDSSENTLIVMLISGGGSALLVSPFEGITLNDKQKTTGLLLKAGANIYELNTVRKHISSVKGGRLTEIAYPVKVISLILSDVIGDRVDVIASGPTSPDKTTYSDAIEVLEKYNLTEKIPQQVLETLNNGVKALISETPTEDNPVFKNVENIIIGSNKKALQNAVAKAVSLGLNTDIISTEISGESKEVGNWLAKKTLDIKKTKDSESPVCLISGGETTVTVEGYGIGGRNMELALSFAIAIEGFEGITFLSAGTDGTDGPTDAAGAIVDGETIKKAKAVGLNPEEYLSNNDSYNFFRKIDNLFITGPTGTNVMDIQIVIIA
jgi:glycerate-2-kinase